MKQFEKKQFQNKKLNYSVQKQNIYALYFFKWSL